jgi:hypothetical protein
LQPFALGAEPTFQFEGIKLEKKLGRGAKITKNKIKIKGKILIFFGKTWGVLSKFYVEMTNNVISLYTN